MHPLNGQLTLIGSQEVFPKKALAHISGSAVIQTQHLTLSPWVWHRIPLTTGRKQNAGGVAQWEGLRLAYARPKVQDGSQHHATIANGTMTE